MYILYNVKGSIHKAFVTGILTGLIFSTFLLSSSGAPTIGGQALDVTDQNSGGSIVVPVGGPAQTVHHVGGTLIAPGPDPGGPSLAVAPMSSTIDPANVVLGTFEPTVAGAVVNTGPSSMTTSNTGDDGGSPTDNGGSSSGDGDDPVAGAVASVLTFAVVEPKPDFEFSSGQQLFISQNSHLLDQKKLGVNPGFGVRTVRYVPLGEF